MIITYFSLFFVSVIILVFATRRFLAIAEKISHVFKISPLIIGMTIVAIGTSLPELAVSGIALLREDAGLAMGNILGSNIINVCLVFAVGIMLGKLQIGRIKTQRDGIILLCVSVLFLIVSKYFSNFFTGLLLVILGVVFTVLQYHWGIEGREKEDSARFEGGETSKPLTGADYILLAISLIGIILGGLGVVLSTEKISGLTGYSTTILGLSLTAIATSLPELLTTFFSQRDHQEKVTTGNIIGSNVYNLLLIGGIIIMFSPASAARFVTTGDWMFFLASTLVFVTLIAVYKGKTIGKPVGILLLLFFLVYLFYLQMSGLSD